MPAFDLKVVCAKGDDLRAPVAAPMTEVLLKRGLDDGRRIVVETGAGALARMISMSDSRIDDRLILS
jgi:hypothetical protein